ncbi:MAG: PD-(D/E)XK nuclease family protein [Flavobacteriales bacterium]|nr:PD-(D/E)XK nuclease family protein [Flavobacteriales bacterium]MBK9699436.1 PD-(D/E)XK nuclease family protein [Flavobacteriales bacterium]
MAFLRLLAERLLHDHGTDLARVAVVLPSRRAGLHLQRHLAHAHGAPLWSPDLLTPDGFLERLSGLREQPVHLTLLDMHAVHRHLKGAAADDLHTFLGWAPTALHDMNEVDEHLLDREVAYRDLRHIEEIDAWSFRGGALSEGQQRLAHHWAHHAGLHQGLEERLLPAGTGTRGLIARAAASRITDGTHPLPWTRVWCAGLNALSPAMHRVLDALRHRGIARFAWDADSHYLNDPLQEAGRALRSAIGRHGPGELPVSTRIGNDPPSAHTIALPNTMAMVHAAVEQVIELSEEERARTCVLLADPHTLLPFLSLLPASCAPVNVTMGLPLTQLPLHGLFVQHARLHSGSDGRSVRTRELSALLDHPAWADARPITELRERTANERRAHLPIAALFQEGDDAVLLALHRALSAEGTAARTALVEAVVLANPDPFVQEQAQRIGQVLGQAATALAGSGHQPGEAGALGLEERLLRQARVDLRGEPMAGLQVMGMLESRATDHDRVIVVGANEGSLPPAEPPQSFIPGELRHALGLPLRADTDTVVAHTFMRLLHHAREITLLHVSGGDVEQERSRFILQLEHELPGVLRRSSLRPSMPRRPDARLHVTMTPELRHRFQRKAERGFSPTALSDLLTCPLNFVFRHGWSVEEEQPPSAALEDHELGTLVHAVFESLYGPFVGGIIQPDALSAGLPAALRVLEDRMPEGLHAEEGPVLLQLGMARQAIERAVRHEVARLRSGTAVTLLGLETPLSAELPEVAHGQRHLVRLHGRVDRIDRRDGHVHLVDLKTGRVAPRDLELTLPGPLKADHGKAVQLLTYAWLWLRNDPECPAVTAELRPLRSTEAVKGLPLILNDRTIVRRQDLSLIEEALGSLIQDLFDPGAVFAHRQKSAYCTICRS